MKQIIISIILPLSMLLLSCSVNGQSYKPAVSILGDSYSTFEGYMKPATNELWYFAKKDSAKTDVSSVEDTWWWKVIDRGGYRLDVNNSYSGATIGYHGYNDNDYSDRSFLTRMTNLGCPDVIIVFGATNDSWAGEAVGDYKWGGWTKADFYTFRPAMAALLYGLKTHYPNVKLLFLINTDMRPEIVESCRTICEHYGVDYLQLKDIKKNYGHPTKAGMESIADQVLAKLKNQN